MKQKQIVVKGTTYTLQGIPFKSFMDINDKNTDKNGNLKKSGYIADLFKHCVIEPRVTMSDFDDDFGAAMELVSQIESFLAGTDDTKAEPGEGTE